MNPFVVGRCRRERSFRGAQERECAAGPRRTDAGEMKDEDEKGERGDNLEGRGLRRVEVGEEGKRSKVTKGKGEK
jgi:hypothetical protein